MRRKIILASGSPRRKELLAKMGVTFQVVPSDFYEELDDNRSVSDVAKELGLGKAKAVAERYPEAYVIGSDTIVSIGNRQLGKPADKAEARRMLRAHDGKMAIVTTSVALVCKELGLEMVQCDQSKVYFKPFNKASVETYLKSGDWQDKAGAWGIQSGAAPLTDHIEGNYDTIIGLPTELLAQLLAVVGIKAKPVALAAPVPQKAVASKSQIRFNKANG